MNNYKTMYKTKKNNDTHQKNRKDEKEEKLKEMGFGEAAVRNALSRAAGDEQQALELLLTGL